MKVELRTLKIHLTVLFLEATLSYGLPQDKFTANVARVASKETEPDCKIRRCSKSGDVVMYHENRDDGVLKSLCWAELFIITENNNNKEKNLTNEFAIVLESPGDITKENLSEGTTETYTLFDSETKKNKTLNFTIMNKTKEYTIKQHKTLHCGAGPILIKTYIEWPKRNKQKIEIRLAPTAPSKWTIFSDSTSLDYDANTLPPSTQPFDTTTTESYSYTNFEDVTVTHVTTRKSLLERDTDEEIVTTKSAFKHNNDSDNLNLGSKNEYESNEVPQNEEKKKKVNKEPVLKSSSVNASIDKDRLSDLKLELKRELLMRNMYFKKFKDSEIFLNLTEPNIVDNLEYDAALYLFDLIYPNKTVSLWKLKDHHKFLINIEVSIEHIIVENVNGTEQETPLSITVLEEENVYRFKSN